jgi:amino-acid N-acetyltransferase
MIRAAQTEDAHRIQFLVNHFAAKGEMLTLSLNEIYEKIFEFLVWEEDDIVKGCCAIHPTWENLAEIRSLAVEESQVGKGIGKKLVIKCIEKAKKIGVNQVFALTYQVDFFKKLGFKEITKEELPQKIWTDCLKCVKFPNCDENAVIIDI